MAPNARAVKKKRRKLVVALQTFLRSYKDLSRQEKDHNGQCKGQEFDLRMLGKETKREKNGNVDLSA